MANEEHLATLRQGAEAWNRWRSENPEIRPDLSGAWLRESDFGGEEEQAINFAGCDLRGAQFERSVLWGANFEGANLDAANLRRTNLSKANFRNTSLQAAGLGGADLIDAQFGGANLYKAVLEDANLEHSDLSSARSLSAEQLAGTKLVQTALPSGIAHFPALKIVDELSRNARTLVISMLGACAYCWLTILQTKDYSLINPLSAESAKLPIIDVDLAIALFYAIAPCVLLGLYLYVHFTLARLWSTISLLPAVFPGGEPLTAVVYTWLPPDVICRFIPRLKDQTQPFRLLQRWTTVLLVWLCVPATIGLFWAWYLTAHDWPVTVAHIFLTAASATAAVIFYRSIGTALSPPRGRREFQRRTTVTRAALGTLVPSFGALAVCLFISYGALYAPAPSARPQDQAAARTLYAKLLHAIASNSFFHADIRSHDPAGSKSRPFSLAGRNLTYVCAHDVDLTSADLNGADLRFADLAGTKFNGADLSGADLRGAELTGASFVQDASLVGVKMAWADIQGADFGNAVAGDAHFEHANLENAKFGDAYLRDAHFAEAILYRADLTGAILMNANFAGALFFDHGAGNSEFEGVSLRTSLLQGANFARATLDRVDLTGADLTNAILEGASLRNAILSGAKLNGADLWGADLRGATQLEPQQLKGKAKNWDMAFYDHLITDALGLPRNHNECERMARLSVQYHETPHERP